MAETLIAPPYPRPANLDTSIILREDAPQIMRQRPLITTDEPGLPMDLHEDVLEQRLKYYEHVRSIQPALLLGTWRNPNRRGEEVYLYDPSDRFVGYFMPTRSGKGVSFGFPNAVQWPHSLFLTDPKREFTAGAAWWRKYGLGQRIFIVEPFATDGRNARWNPLREIRLRTASEVTDAQAVATAIVDPDGSGFDGEHGPWKKRARTLITAIILHILYSDRYTEKSLRSVDAFFARKMSLEEKYKELLTAVHDPTFSRGWIDVDGNITRTHPVVAMAAQEQKQRPEGEGGSVLSEMMSYTELYRNNTLGDNTAESDFSIADIMRGPVPATVFYVTTPDVMELCHAYTRLFLNLLINRNTPALDFDVNVRPINPYNYKLAVIADEFTSVYGKLDVFARRMAFVAGYGLKIAIIVQDLQQLYETYGERNNILSNLHTTVFGATVNPKTAQEIEELSGDFTYYRWQGRGAMRSMQPDSTKVIPRDLARQLPHDEAALFMAHEKPIPMKKLKYYSEDSGFSERIRRCDFASDRLPPHYRADFFERLKLEHEEQVAAERRIAHAREIITSGGAPVSDAEKHAISQLDAEPGPATAIASPLSPGSSTTTTPAAPTPVAAEQDAWDLASSLSAS